MVIAVTSAQPAKAGAAEQAVASTVPNRTTPKSGVPKPGLEFPANPEPSDFLRARVFDGPLVPVGGQPSREENVALAAALVGYAKRSGPDDFGSLTTFLDQHPASPWAAALLTGLGLEYYNTAHYSLALDAWRRAWSHVNEVRDAKGKAVVDRAVSELAYLYARLGRMTELEALLKSVEGKVCLGGEIEKITGAREALWTMKNRPEIAFRCGPMALHRIKLAFDPQHPATEVIFKSASTQRGFSLPQVAELSRRVGLNYQMAFREKGGDFVVPSVVHWKVGHYAAMVRQVGDRYLLEDPTFGNTVWATREALEAETSGYFLIPPGDLPRGWRSVKTQEGDDVWGKGVTSSNDPDVTTCRDLQTASCGAGGSCQGMAISSVHLMTVNLQIRDTPLGYVPPVGPPVWFTVRYNHRFGGEGNFGVKWSCDWASFIADNPQSPMADVKYYVGGGGARTFTGFDTNTQTYAFQLYDQTQLKRTGTNSYEMLWPDGSKKIFAQSDGSIGTVRKVFLTQVVDPQGNAVTLTYDTNLFLVAITDAIGQVTTLTYGGVNPITDAPLLTSVTDPFGRSAKFDYGLVVIGLACCGDPCKPCPINSVSIYKITDVLGLASQVNYNEELDYYGGVPISLVTPYGTNSFTLGSATNGTTRYVETLYPDGSRERVEFNQGVNVPASVPPASVPVGMNTTDLNLQYRNTFYWSRNACATAYGDYFKAKIFHWLHTGNGSGSASGILESTKHPLEGRVWYDYGGQLDSLLEGSNNIPAHVGRVLDDGSTQLYTYTYNGFGHVTSMVDPVGRTFSLVYDTNGIDLVEVRQTRAANNELLARTTYNAQHRPLTVTDAAGQTNTFTYNARGQLLTATNPKGETTTFSYDPNGYLLAVDGPLPGTNDLVTLTYDAFGRIRALTDVSGYTLTFDHDTLDRLTRVTFPDGTFTQYAYDLLNLVGIQDRAGRVTFLEHDNMRQTIKKVDPLGRVTLFDWCHCGALRSLTDPMGRKTTWLTDVQGRPIAKQYADGSQVAYSYEQTTSRIRLVTDEKLQGAAYSYNVDDTLRSVGYVNCAVPTPAVTYTYDRNYKRLTLTTDGIGTTRYSYNPVAAPPTLGAGRLASVDGPLTNATITYSYDELGRMNHRAIDGVDLAVSYDAAWRVVGFTNALGAFTRAFDGSSDRILLETFPNGQTASLGYGSLLQGLALQRITYAVGATPISEFLYGRDLARDQITTWSQQAGTQPPNVYSFGYDDANQVLSATVTNAGAQVNAFAYSYDPAGNRLAEQVGSAANTATYNSLNQISTTTAASASRTNEWDAVNRLVAVNAGNQRIEFAYDGLSRLASIRLLTNGVQASLRQFVWSGSHISEERDSSGVVTKRFFHQGVKFESGTNAGSYYYTRDHLGSVREVTDAGGNLRVRYAYDPYGRRTRVSGDLDTDFGFAGMFWAAEASLALTHFRAYDPELGRWLSRDPLRRAEMREGPNLYAYVRNEPLLRRDAEGLATLPGLGFTSVTVTLTAIELEDPDAATFLVQELQLGAQRVGQVAPEAEEFCVQASETFPGFAPVGPDTVNVIARTVPQLAQAVRNVAQSQVIDQVEEAIEAGEPWVVEANNPLDLAESSNWWFETMKGLSDYGTYLQREGKVAEWLDLSRFVSNFSHYLYGGPLWPLIGE